MTRRRPARPLTADTRGRRFNTFRLSELVHALVIVRALCHRPHTLAELAALLGLHHRSVRRYLQAIELVGIPLDSHAARRRTRPVRLWWTDAASVGGWLRAGAPPVIRARRLRRA